MAAPLEAFSKNIYKCVSKEWISAHGALPGLPTCSFGDDVGPKSKAKVGKKINLPLTDNVRPLESVLSNYRRIRKTYIK
ncbi:hypothetical protein KIN20_022648 [Parelaphostrongylus tenuis]|uniref:Uncharacterized protein n=1 Tax=Parelaphostrongylus tenuis TaxID=148309 RepID=A0AAD5QVI3_PARTN|nr:hypothetical protein KIN20_022648 [Parelaphostrongylus tenuis]